MENPAINKKNPTISIIVPFRNSERYFHNCLSSIKNQTFQDFEAILVDDCSTDTSRAIAENFTESDDRFHLLAHARQKGPGGARNSGILASKAKYVTGLDSDDWMNPQMLEKLWASAENGRNDVVICGYHCLSAKGQAASIHKPRARRISANTATIDIFNLTNPAFWNKLWRRTLFTVNGIWFPEEIYFEDLATIPRLIATARSIRIISDSLYFYRAGHGLSSRTSAKHIFDYFHVYDILRDFLKNQGLFPQLRETFEKKIDASLSYHARNVLEVDMPKEKLVQYLKAILMMKVAFLEYSEHLNSLKPNELIHLINSAKSISDLHKIKFE